MQHIQLQNVITEFSEDDNSFIVKISDKWNVKVEIGCILKTSVCYRNDSKSYAVISSEMFLGMAVKLQSVHLSCTMANVDLLKSSHSFTERTLDQESWRAQFPLIPTDYVVKFNLSGSHCYLWYFQL